MIKNNQNLRNYEEYSTLENEGDKEQLGLCTTCKNGPTCMFLNGVSRQILHCEEFQVSQEEVEKQVNTFLENNKEPKTEIKGLCATCENLSECSYNKPESGIWHCEDYA